MRFKRFISFFFSSASRAVFRWQQHGISLHSDSFLVSFICLFYIPFFVTRSGETFYNLLRRLFRRTFATQIYDNAWFPSLYTQKSCCYRSIRIAIAPLSISSLYVRVKPNASFAVAWFPSSLYIPLQGICQGEFFSKNKSRSPALIHTCWYSIFFISFYKSQA